MSQSGLLKRTVRTLDGLAVGYMLTGSLVSSLQGQPRSTHAIDFVVDLPRSRVADLVQSFPPPDFDYSPEAASQAVDHFGMFNVVDTMEGDKVDFWILSNSPFDRSRFGRRIRIPFEEIQLTVTAPEDTILMKLQWARDSGGSDRQLRDAKAVFDVHRESLDRDYLSHWIRELQLEELWSKFGDALGDGPKGSSRAR